MPSQRQQSQTVVERFTAITDPTEFQAEVNTLWEAVAEIKDVIAEKVTAGDIPVLQGLGMVACVTGQAFGYPAFHGQQSPIDLLTVLAPSAGSRS